MGVSPGHVICTGRGDSSPAEPDGLLYVQCRRCKKWLRFEVAPPEPVVEVRTA